MQMTYLSYILMASNSSCVNVSTVTLAKLAICWPKVKAKKYGTRGPVLPNWGRIDRRDDLDAAAHRDENSRAARRLFGNRPLACVDGRRTGKGIDGQLDVFDQIAIGREGHVNDVVGLQ